MKIVPANIVLITFLLFLLHTTATEARKETSITSKIYIPLESKHFCFRRFNATHQFGCASKYFFRFI